MNAVIELGKDSCEVWTGSQLPTVDQYVLSQITGLSNEKITIHTQFAGGSFGRRAVPDSDYIAESAFVAKAMKSDRPLLLQWSREDDVKGGRYRPMAYHHFKGRVDAEGTILAWHQRVVSPSILRGTPFEGLVQGPIDRTVVEGGSNLPYDIADLTVDAHEAKTGVPVLWWRAVGHTHNAYTTEVFLDELAHKMKKDPMQLRKALLKKHPRHVKALATVEKKSQWGRKMPANQAQGVAVHESFGSFVAQVAEVTLNEDKTFKVDKIYCAVDCGIAISPDVIKAQMEGGIGYGLSAAISEAITLKDGMVEQNNFHDYPVLRMNQMPEIEVFIVQSDEAPTGVGEPGTPPAAPAVANALRQLLDKPLVTLPWTTKLV
jgi:isoquinoline 1-oxidoreductase beta subunit